MEIKLLLMALLIIGVEVMAFLGDRQHRQPVTPASIGPSSADIIG